MITVTVANQQFDVEITGDIRQPNRVPPFILDEVRLAAASEYLSKKRGLTKSEHFYWQGVSRKTDLAANFPMAQRGRGRR